MQPWMTLLALVMACLATACSGQGTGGVMSPRQIAQLAIPSVVLIRTSAGLGSGFVAGTGGKIITNFHVIRGAVQAVITTSDHTEYKDVRVIAADASRDLAVLWIDAPGLTPLRLADSEQAQPGEHVVAIGNPLGLGDTVSDGLLSGIRSFPRLKVLQISAPTSPGSSGGPVFNDRGEVIGVSTFLLTGGQNLTFAIPINAARLMLAGEKTITLAALAAMAPKRHIPDLPMSALDACPAPQLQSVVKTITHAVEIGAPLFDHGNTEACFRIYEDAALDVQKTVSECDGPKRVLTEGMNNAAARPDWPGKAWALRDSFDGIMAVVMKGAAAKAGIFVPDRHVPDIAASVVRQCPAGDISAIATAISGAVDNGAPLYNAGNVEACYRIYEGAINNIDRSYPNCPAARGVLQDGARRADGLSGWRAKSWALRDAFDGLLNAIAAVQPPVGR